MHTLDVRHVDVALTFDWPARQARGTAALRVSLRQAGDLVTLDAGMLAIETVTLADGRPLTYQYDGGDRDDGLAITLDRPYQPHERLTLRITYRTLWVDQSDPNNLWGSPGKGLRFFEPTASDPRKRWQIWSSPTPGTQRYWLPAVDAPGQRPTAVFSATVPAPLQVVAPGRLAGTQQHADGSRTFTWRMDNPHAHHRTPFVVGDFHDVKLQHDGITLHNFGYPDEVQGVTDSVERLPDMVRFFGELTGLRYPYASYAQVFVQDYLWGMGGSGMAVQSENMIDDHGTHADFLYLWDGLQDESLAHQWFGAHVSACDWRHTWLERGIAHHLSALYAEHKIGREEFLLWFVQGDQQTALSDWAAGQRAAVVPAGTVDLPAFAASNAPYARGAAVLHMLRKELGDDTWRRVLREHVRRHGGASVCTESFRQVAQDVSPTELGWFFKQWVVGSGHLVFEVTSEHVAVAGELLLRVRQVQPADSEGTEPSAVPRYFQCHVDVAVDERVHRVWLQAQAENLLRLPAASAPGLVHFDVESTWLKDLRMAKPADALLHQLRSTTDTLGRQWAAMELARLVKDPATPAAVPNEFCGALANLAGGTHYWRVRFNALLQMRSELAPATPGQPLVLDEGLRSLHLAVVKNDGAWLRAAALTTLGMTRAPALAPLYLAHLRDTSDRVINAAAIALGRSRSRSPLAYDALVTLPSHPSWKNQSLISALAGLKELADPRGASLALSALADLKSARWTLSTPIWGYRIAAVQTLVALGQGGRAHDMLHGHYSAGLAADNVNDLFSNLLLLVTLGDVRTRDEFLALRARFSADANELKAVEQFATQLEDVIKAR